MEAVDGAMGVEPKPAMLRLQSELPPNLPDDVPLSNQRHIMTVGTPTFRNSSQIMRSKSLASRHWGYVRVVQACEAQTSERIPS